MVLGLCLILIMPFSYFCLQSLRTYYLVQYSDTSVLFLHSGHSLNLASVCQLPSEYYIFLHFSECAAQSLPSHACPLLLHIYLRLLALGRELDLSIVTLEMRQNGSHIKFYAKNIKVYLLIS